MLSQKIFGDDKQKMELYKSMVKDGGKLLDFGCSNGNTFPIFSDFEYYGFDTDKIMIRNAKARFKDFKNANFYTMNILNKRPPQRNFDKILFALTGHHINDKDLIKIFYKLAGILKNGGYIYYFDSIRTKQDSILLRLLLNMDQGKYIRDRKKYKKLIKDLPKNLKVRKSKIYQVRGTLMPQPKYIYFEIQKV